MTQYVREILQLLGSDRRKLPWLLLLFLGGSLLDLAGIGLVAPYIALVIDPQLMKGRLGDLMTAIGMPREQKSGLIILGLLLVSIFLLKGIAAIGIFHAITRFSRAQQVRLQSKLMSSYQSMPYIAHLRRNSSEYIHSIVYRTTHFAEALRLMLRTIADGIVAVGILGFLAWYSFVPLALLAGMMIVVVAGYDRFLGRRLRAYGHRVNVVGTSLLRAVQEGIEGLKEIRILGKEHLFHRTVYVKGTEYARLNTIYDLIRLVPRYLLELTLVVYVVGLVLVTLLLGYNLRELLPLLSMFGVAGLRLMPAANNLSTSLIQLRYYRTSVFSLYQDLQVVESAPKNTLEASLESDLKKFRRISLKHVQFSYPTASRPGLKDLSLQIRAGERIGLIGPSGSGKTTLVDVLLGLLEPQAGEVRYNDQPLKETLAEWRAQVAYLPQQVFLIDDTLRRNVALGVENMEIDDTHVRYALRQARLQELVAELPDGIETMLGERGVRLSGGQRQRVALARAFYHGRGVLVMDEATSALDDETEREIVDEIRRLKGDKTLIVIAHRLTTVQYCDRIYRMRNGTIVEQGTYEQIC